MKRFWHLLLIPIALCLVAAGGKNISEPGIKRGTGNE